MRIKAALYNADHLEYGLVTIPFPIPQDQYNDTIKMLESWTTSSKKPSRRPEQRSSTPSRISRAGWSRSRVRNH